VLAAGGKLAEAERFTKDWRRDHPDDAVFIFHLGDEAAAHKDYTSAASNYLAASKLRPDDAASFNNLAWVMNRLGNDGAATYAERAVQIEPNQPVYIDTLAMILADARQYPRAIELQKKAVELQPQNSSLRLNLAKIYIKAGDKTRARAELDLLSGLGDKFSLQPEVIALKKSL
jgi:predicted Zn-dependent protease